MSSNRKASAMSPVTSKAIETAGRNWLPPVVAKERISEAQNIRGVKRAMDCKFPAYRGGGWEAGPGPPPAAMFHPHSGHTGSSEAMRRHLGQIRMVTCIIAYFVDPTDRKVYPDGRSNVAGGDPADAPPAPTRARRGTTRSKRAAHSKARGNPGCGQGHVHGAESRHPARGDRGARPLGGRRRARQHLPSR